MDRGGFEKLQISNKEGKGPADLCQAAARLVHSFPADHGESQLPNQLLALKFAV